MLSGNSSAAEWTVSKGAKAEVTLTDNVELSEDDEQSEITTSITPRIAFAGKGARANVKFSGAVKINDSSRGAGTFNPRIQANADSELIKQLLYIDGSFKASQNALNPFTSGGGDTENESDNVTTTYSYSISPYVKRRLKDFATFLARYTYDEVIHTNDDAANSAGQSVNVSLDSGPMFSRVSWGLGGQVRKVDNDDGDNSEFKSADANLGYRFNRAWRVNASAGKEWNDFTTVKSDNDGTRWDFHAIWTPSPRTSLDIGYGERFFGGTPSLDFTHRSRRSTIKLGYSRELTDARTLILQEQLFIETDPITNQPILVARDIPVLGDSVLVNERFDGSYTLQGKRSKLRISADHSTQIYQDAVTDGSKLMGLSVNFDRTLDGKTSANAGIRWRHSEQSSGEEADTGSIDVGLTRKLGPKTNVKLSLRHTERDSDVADDSYDENRVTVALDIDL
jgi:hypothetical protein